MAKADLERGYTKPECDRETGREERQTPYNKGLYNDMGMGYEKGESGGFIPRNNTQDRL